MNAAHILPECSRMTREHAADLAAELVEAIQIVGRTVSLFLTADGVLGCSFIDEDRIAGMPLVGRYDNNATAQQICEDILTLQEEALA